MSALNELSQIALASVVEYGAGFVSGLMVDNVFPSPLDAKKSASQELIEVGAQVALDGILISQFGSYLTRSLNPGNVTGGGLFFLGLVSTQDNFRLRAKRLASRVKIAALDFVDEEIAAAAQAQKEQISKDK